MDLHQSMPAERSLQWNIGILTAYGTVLLGMGQGDPTLPTLSVFATLTSILFTDRYQWFRLPRSLGNLAAMIALVVCVLDFFQDRERQLLAIAHLLVYLQIILLYQQKSPRVYWQLIVLSLLQVVVAAALNEHINFGILLVGYLFTSLMAISRLFILRESLRAAQGGITVVGPRHPALAGGDAWNEAGSYIRPLQTQNRAEQATASRTSRSMLGWRWATDLAVFSAGTLIAAFLFFFMTPRIAGEPWEAAAGGAEVGFNPNDVSLNDLTQIQQSETVVMRVRFVDVDTGRPLQIESEFFLRGAVKSEYLSNGRWTNSRVSENLNNAKLPLPPSSGSLVRQEFTLEPTNHNFLFYVGPVFQAPEGSGGIHYKPHSLELQTARRRRAEFPYNLVTNAFTDTSQREIVPQVDLFGKTEESNAFNKALSDEMLRFNRQLNPWVARIAEEQVAQLSAEATSRYAVAKKLESYFVEPGRFQYTLDPQVARIAAGRDPVEVFLTEVRSGHCEYFASSLALMLRSRGIPSRVVIGYYGGEYNAVGDYYVVKEKFAHAWVEAYLRPEDIPPGALPSGTDVQRGAWLRLNPTPESIAQAEIERTLWTGIAETFDYVQMLWREYVLNLNSEQQVEKIYQPLSAMAMGLKALLTSLTDQQAWSETIESAAERMGIDIHGQLRRISWFYWPAGLVVISFGLIGIALMQVGKTVRRTIAPSPQIARQRDKPPAFYEKFERLGRRYRLRRASGETPHEYAARIGQLLAAHRSTASAAERPAEIVSGLYRVRFSGRPLDKAEAEAIENALIAVSEALQQWRLLSK